MNDQPLMGKPLPIPAFDLKAEAVVCDLLLEGLGREDFVAVPAGGFRRRYSSDIAEIQRLNLENGQDILAMNLNRDGLYDTLPEGFFHQDAGKNLADTRRISRESMRLKAEEKAARRFFLPFENELFNQRVGLETEERRILESYSQNLFDGFPPEFWNIDPELDQKLVSGMVRYLHMAYRIAGNPGLTGKCLENILGEKTMAEYTGNLVSISAQNDGQQDFEGCTLGSARLGAGMVCGDTLNLLCRAMLITIGPVHHSPVSEYLGDGRISRFLQCFCDYFIPAGMQVVMKIIAGSDDKNFTLTPDGEGAILGYKTVLGPSR